MLFERVYSGMWGVIFRSSGAELRSGGERSDRGQRHTRDGSGEGMEKDKRMKVSTSF